MSLQTVAEGCLNFNVFVDEPAAQCNMLEAIEWEESPEIKRTASDLRCASQGDSFIFSAGF